MHQQFNLLKAYRLLDAQRVSFESLLVTWCTNSLNFYKATSYVIHQQFNLLKPTCYVMHQQNNLLNPTGRIMHQQIKLLKGYWSRDPPTV
jgi:hypothetical protein